MAGLAVAALGLVVASRGGGDDDTAASLPKLPVGAGSEVQADEDARMASTSIGFAPAGRYVPGEGLPSLGGSAPAYKLTADVTEASVRRLAEAFGITGEPTDDGAGYWTVDGDEMTLSVNGPDGSWSVFRRDLLELPPDEPGVDGVTHPTVVVDPELLCPDNAVEAPGPPQVAEDTTPPEPCGTPLPLPDEPTVDAAPTTIPVPVEPTAPIRPESLPSQDEAKRIALDLLAATGADVDGAEVRVEDAVTEWYVSIEPRVDGLRAAGLGMYVGIGDKGRITTASGSVATPVKLGDYPLLDTRAALERLNESRVYFGGPVPETTVPGEVSILPVPEPGPAEEPPDVPVTDAEIVLISEFTNDVDDMTTYLVPAYRFTADDGSAPEVNAVVDALLEQPDPTSSEPPVTPTVAEPGTEPDPGSGGGSDSHPGSPGDDPAGSVEPAPPPTPLTTVPDD